VPVEWGRRLTLVWIALSIAWVVLFPLALVLTSDHESLRAWLADPEEPGWVWLFAPPVALGIVLRLAAGVSHATFRRNSLYWNDLPHKANRTAKPAAPRPAATPAVGLPPKGAARERERVQNVEALRQGRRARR
jgi:hypothetical protein